MCLKEFKIYKGRQAGMLNSTKLGLHGIGGLVLLHF